MTCGREICEGPKREEGEGRGKKKKQKLIHITARSDLRSPRDPNNSLARRSFVFVNDPSPGQGSTMVETRQWRVNKRKIIGVGTRDC